MNFRYIAWCCPACGYWQKREIRFEKDLGNKLRKTSLKCLRCNKSKIAKSGFGLNVIGQIFDDPKRCMAEIRLKNVPEEFCGNF